MTRKIIFNLQCLMVGLLLSCFTLNAQHRHEFLLSGSGGLSSLQYEAATGKQKNGLGGNLGLGYRFFFSPQWGLGTGVELACYNTRYNADNISIRYMATDMNGDGFEFRSTVNGYEEKQQATLVQIPLMLQFQTGNKHRFYAAAGGKVGIPVGGKYESSNTGIQNSGYYEYEDKEYTTQTFMGFGQFTGKGNEGDLSFKTAFFASVELGMKWALNESWSLYTGAYLDYGLNDIAKTQARPFVEFNTESPKDFRVNNIVNSQYQTSPFIGKITPVAAGIKLGVAFGR